MYNANITFGQFATYETLLLSRGLLACATDRYWATEKGNRFVEAFSQLQSTLENASPRTIPLENLSRSGKADLWPKK
jgi:predicted transcriptional regulator